MSELRNIVKVIDGRTYTFSVKTQADDAGFGAPWENQDGHGPVSEWTTRGKRAGEWTLVQDRSSRRFYDFAEACKIALRDGWDHLESKPEGEETPAQRASRAAKASFEYLKGWIEGDWWYVGVIVTLLDADGEETEYSESLWGIESSSDDYILKVANDLSDEIIWGREAAYSADNLTPEELEQKYGYEHPEHPREVWRGCVADQETLTGYWSWVEHQCKE